MKRAPERTCLGCSRARAQATLLRLVCNAEGAILLDRSGRSLGRGAYVCGDMRCLRKTLKSTRLATALRQAVVVPAVESLCAEVTALFQARLQGYIQLARKAGVVVSGYAALEKALARGQVRGMVVATDVARARETVYRAWCTQHAIPCFSLFAKEELGRLLGRPSRSAIGFTEHRFVEHLETLITTVEQWHASSSVTEGRPASFSPAS